MLNIKEVIAGSILRYNEDSTSKILILTNPSKKYDHIYKASVVWIGKDYWQVVEDFDIILDKRWIKLC